MKVTYHLAILTSFDCEPVLRARMEYPVLCQSMINFASVQAEMNWANPRVGIDGGFWVGEIVQCFHTLQTPKSVQTAGTYLYDYDFGEEREFEDAEVDYWDDLVDYSDGCSKDPW